MGAWNSCSLPVISDELVSNKLVGLKEWFQSFDRMGLRVKHGKTHLKYLTTPWDLAISRFDSSNEQAIAFMTLLDS